jgi:hypothetical protein
MPKGLLPCSPQEITEKGCWEGEFEITVDLLEVGVRNYKLCV